MSLYGGGQMTGVAVDSGQVCLFLFCFFRPRLFVFVVVFFNQVCLFLFSFLLTTFVCFFEPVFFPAMFLFLPGLKFSWNVKC